MANNIEAKLIDEQTGKEHLLEVGKCYLIGKERPSDIVVPSDRADSINVARFHCIIKGEKIGEFAHWSLIDFKTNHGTKIQTKEGKTYEINYEKSPQYLGNDDRIILAENYKFVFKK